MPRNPGRTTKPFSASTSSTSKPEAKRRQKTDGEAYTFIPSLPKRHRTSEQTLSLSREEAGPSRRRRPARTEGDEDEDSDEGMAERVRKVAMLIAQDDLAEVDDSESSVQSDEAWEEEGSDEERWGDVFRDLNNRKGKGKRKVEVVRKAAIPLNVNLDESDDDAPSKPKGKGKAKAAPVKSAPKQLESIADDESDEELGFGAEEDESDDLDSELDDAELSPNEFEADDGIQADDGDDASSEGPADGDDSSSGSGEAEDEEDNDDDEDEDDEMEIPSDLSDEESINDLGPTSLDGLDAFVDRLTESSKKRDAPSEATGGEKKRRVLDSKPAPALDGNDLGLKSRTKVDLASLIASHPSLSSASALLPKTTKSSSKPTSILKQGTLPAPLPTSVQDRLNREAAYEATKEEGAKWAGVMKRIKEAEHLSFPLQAAERGGVKSSGEMLAEYKPRQGLESAVQALLAKANLTEDGITKRENDALEGQEFSLEEMEERRKRLREQRELMFRAEARAKRVAKIKSKTFRKLARKRAAKAGVDLEEDFDDEEAREKAEMDRARERATLKHGARTSRWARHADQMGLEEGRMAKEEMLDIKQRLSRRIQGQGESESEEESESEDGDEVAIKDRAFDQLAKVQTARDSGKEEGLMGMAFMKKARVRQVQKAQEEEEGLKRDIEMFGDLEGSESEGNEEDEAEGTMMNVGGTGGRMVFSGPAARQPAQPTKAQLPSAQAPANRHTARREVHFDAPSDPAVNPWLAQTSSSGPSRKRQHGITADSSAADKAVKSLKQAAARDTTAQEEDGRVEITLDPEAILGGDDGDEEVMGTMPRKRVKLGQRDLIAEAFAGDNVVEDFAAEKARIVAEDAPQVEDTTLPGWGSWGGKGLKKRKSHPSRLVVKPGIDPSTRADAPRENVIISEKKDKKAAKYLVKDLPYPYTSKAQYEKRFENPLGAEWNSRAGHQRETLPRVMKKPGAIIEPVRRLF